MASRPRLLAPSAARGGGSGAGRKSTLRARLAPAAFLAAGSVLLLSSSGGTDLGGYFSATAVVGRYLAAVNAPRKKKPARRVALLRPFGPRDGPDLLRSFDLWDTHWPCAAAGRSDYAVDLVVSYSRRLDDDEATPREVKDAVEGIRSKFASAGHGGGGWSGCLGSVRLIEADVDPSRDSYDHGEGEPADRDWVYGPNEQFRRSLRTIAAMGPPEGGNKGSDGKDHGPGGYYEVAVIMEPDTQPRRAGWLDELLDDVAGKGPFAILGSKYKGHSWDNMKDILPRSLLEHINGNAAYNLTHPLMTAILDELELEKDTYLATVPYDYRISQMLEEGRSGTPPEFPFPKIRDAETGEPVVLPRNEAKFKSWWEKWGKDEPVKDSNVIANLADTNYLPEHLGEEALVHGQNVFRPWDPRSHKISLVVSDWSDNLSDGLLSALDESDHPFSEVIVMVDQDVDDDMERPSTSLWDKLAKLSGRSSSSFASRRPKPAGVPVRFVKRSSLDILDVCDAPVSTEWFFHTNAYHAVSRDVDLLFTDESPVPRPVVPYIPSDATHCDRHDACRETLRLAREIFPGLDRVVLDMNLPYHAPSRNSYCAYWREQNGEFGEKLARREGGREAHLARSVPLGPTATGYIAYLRRHGMDGNLYAFANVLLHGSKDSFDKVHGAAEAESRRLEVERAGGMERLLRRAPPPSDAGQDRDGEHRNLPKATCTADGRKTTACGAKKGNDKPCCGDLVCSTDSSNTCVTTGTYGGGSARRALALSAPGMLVEA